MLTKALDEMAKQYDYHMGKAAKIETEHMNFDCKFDTPENEAAHDHHSTTAQQLELMASHSMEACEYFRNQRNHFKG